MNLNNIDKDLDFFKKEFSISNILMLKDNVSLYSNLDVSSKEYRNFLKYIGNQISELDPEHYDPDIWVFNHKENVVVVAQWNNSNFIIEREDGSEVDRLVDNVRDLFHDFVISGVVFDYNDN